MLANEKTIEKLVKENYLLKSRVMYLEQMLKEDKKTVSLSEYRENVYRHIVEEQDEMICRIMPDYTITFINNSLALFLNRKPEDIIRCKLQEVVPELLSNDFFKFLKTASPDNAVEICQHKIQREDGSQVWLEWKKNLIFLSSGELVEMQFVGRDISAQKAMEQELRLSRARYHNIINGQSELVACCAPDTSITFVNDACCKFFNKNYDELFGLSFLNLVFEPDRSAIKQLIKGATGKSSNNYPWRIIGPDGSIIWQEWNTRAVFNEDGQVIEFQMVGRDITERLAMERALKESEAIYRAIFETTGTAMMIYRYDTMVELVNTEFEKLSGYTREEIEGKMRWTEFIDKRDVEMMLYYHKIRIHRQEEVPPNYEFRLLDRQGNVKNIYISLAAIPENQTVVASFMDITERKATEQALKKSEEKFSSTFKASPNELIISTIAEGRFIDVNPRFCETIEREYDEVIGCTSADLKMWVDPMDRMEMIDFIIKNGSVRNREYSVRTKTEKILDVLVSSEAIELDGKQCMITIMNDISEMKQMKKEMARLDQLNMVGEIAASIGHEVRNPMTSVRGFLQLLKEDENYNYYRDYFSLMIEEIDRANHIITEFLTMARHKKVDWEMIDLNNIIKTVAPLINADAVSQDKRLRLELHNVPLMLADQQEMRQLIYNLARNALEAMAAGKCVTIKTYVENDQSVLAVTDEGPGIDEALIEKMVEPFFTTKENGTGLGLPVCYSIAARHQAVIKVDTSKKGSTFYVYFNSTDKQLYTTI